MVTLHCQAHTHDLTFPWQPCVCVCAAYLQVSAGGDGGDALHEPGVAAARTPLHLHARRPQHEVGVAAVQHGPGHLHHLRPNLAGRLLRRLGLHCWRKRERKESEIELLAQQSDERQMGKKKKGQETQIDRKGCK